MHTPTQTKQQLIRQAVIYTLMTATVIITVFLLVSFMLGYRFNRTTGEIEQGGLAQFNSTPTGVTILVDSVKLSSSTPTKATLRPGAHDVVMSRDGYHSWQKAIDMKSGSILWLNYARLIPTTLKVEDSLQLPAITSTISSPNRKWIAMTTEANLPTVTLVDISSDKPVASTLHLPEGSYSTPPEGVENETYTLTDWDFSSRYLLVKHSFADQIEWIVVDTQNAANTKNISTTLDIPIASIKFSNTDNHIFFALVNDDIRKININAATISAPLIRGVAEFSLFDRSIVAYVSTTEKETNRRTVGYYTDGASKPRVIRSYSGDTASSSHHISFGKYFNDTYVAISYGGTTDILTGSLPNSGSDDPLTLSSVETISLPVDVDYLSNKTSGRFFVVQHQNNYSVYDLELERWTTTAVKGDGQLTGMLNWIDGYTVWSDLGGTLRFYEFDGENQHDIMPILPGQNPALSPNNRYFYAPTKNADGVIHLSRVRLIL